MSTENTKKKTPRARKATAKPLKATAASSMAVVLEGLERENARRRKRGLAPLSYGQYVAQLENR